MSLTQEVRAQRWRLAVVGLLAVDIVIGLVGLPLCVRPHARRPHARG
jgi:hypothetical protein